MINANIFTIYRLVSFYSGRTCGVNQAAVGLVVILVTSNFSVDRPIALPHVRMATDYYAEQARAHDYAGDAMKHDEIHTRFMVADY